MINLNRFDLSGSFEAVNQEGRVHSIISGRIFPKTHPAIASTGAIPKAPESIAAPQPSTGSSTQVDVEAILTRMAESKGEKLNWRTSIVDLMKLLGLDSDITARKELAKELNYSGDGNDSAAMNIWLHRQVMQKLSENGGIVPKEPMH